MAAPGAVLVPRQDHEGSTILIDTLRLRRPPRSSPAPSVRRAATTCLAVLAFLAVLISLAASARAAELDDPFPLRNQLPFNLVFLDQTPRSARILPRRATRLAIDFAYESTFVTTEGLVSAFRQDDFTLYDGRVTAPILRAAAGSSPGGTAFILDGETLRSLVDFGIGLGGRFEIDAEIPLLLHTSGFLDPFIDDYHDRLGLPDGGRTAFARDRYIAGYVGDGEEIFIDRPPGGVRPGDLVLTGRAALLKSGDQRPDIAAGLSLKLPTGSARRLDGSGSVDAGVSFQISRRFERSTLHGGYAVARIGDWALAPRLPLHSSRSLFVAYSFAATARSHLVVQILRSSGPFSFRPGSDLGRVAQEITAGFRHRMHGGLQLEWAVIENLDRYLNTPDAGVFLGLSRTSAGPGGEAGPPGAG